MKIKKTKREKRHDKEREQRKLIKNTPVPEAYSYKAGYIALLQTTEHGNWREFGRMKERLGLNEDRGLD